MKTKLSLLVLAILALPFTGFGQTGGGGGNVGFPINLEMLKSKAALRAFAIARITRGSISLNDSSQLPGTPNNGYVQVTGADADDVMKKLAIAQLSIRVANNADTVYAYASLEASDGQGIAGGSSNLNLIAMPSGNWTIDPASKLELDVYDWVSIPVGTHVNGAYLSYRDANGNIQWFDYNEYVYNGYLQIQLAYAGEIGELYLTHTDNNGNVTSQAYTLAGVPIIPSTVSGNIAVGLLNFKKVTDQGLAPQSSLIAEMFPILPQGSTKQKGAPVVLVQLAQARTVMAYCGIKDSATSPSPWQVARKVWYRAGNETQFRSVLIIPGSYTPINLPVGTSVISYECDAFDTDPQAPYGGGKG